MGEDKKQGDVAQPKRVLIPRWLDEWIGLALGLLVAWMTAALFEPVFSPWLLDLIQRRGLWAIAHELLVPLVVGVGGTAVAYASWTAARSATRIAEEAAEAEAERAREAHRRSSREAGAQRRAAQVERARSQRADMDARTGELISAIYRYREAKHSSWVGQGPVPTRDVWLAPLRLIEMAIEDQDRTFNRAVYDMLDKCSGSTGPGAGRSLDGICLLLLGWRRGKAGYEEAKVVSKWIDDELSSTSSGPFPFIGKF